MQYRECSCGSKVEEYLDICPICDSGLSAPAASGFRAPDASGPRTGHAAGFDGPTYQDDFGRPAGPPYAPAADRRSSAVAGDDWYYMADGRMEGPCELEFLVASLSCGALAPETQVWRPGMKAWTTPAAIPALSAHLQNGGITEEADQASADVKARGFGSDLQYGELPAGDSQPAEGPVRPTQVDPQILGPQSPITPAWQVAGEQGSLDSAQSGDAAFTSAAAASGAATVSEAGPRSTAASDPVRRERAGPPASPEDTAAHPWRRWFARIVDISLAAFVLGFVLAALAPGLTLLDSDILGSMVVLAAWLVAEPFVLGGLGTTPGKALMNIKLRQADGVRLLRLNQAFDRSFRVWFYGMAGGLPIVSLFTMANAYVKLDREGATPWDQRGGFVVTHGDLGTGRVVGIAASICFLLLFAVAGSLA